MSNYRRLISYIYAYEGGVKGKNIGFAKIETRGTQLKITVSVKKVYVGGNDVGVYLLAQDAEIYLGNIFIRGGSGEFRTVVSASDVEHSGISAEQCYGLTVHDVKNTWRSYTTIWEDAVAHAAEVDLAGAAVKPSEPGVLSLSEAMIKRAVKEIEEEFPLPQLKPEEAVVSREKEGKEREENNYQQSKEVLMGPGWEVMEEAQEQPSVEQPVFIERQAVEEPLRELEHVERERQEEWRGERTENLQLGMTGQQTKEGTAKAAGGQGKEKAVEAAWQQMQQDGIEAAMEQAKRGGIEGTEPQEKQGDIEGVKAPTRQEAIEAVKGYVGKNIIEKSEQQGDQDRKEEFKQQYNQGSVEATGSQTDQSSAEAAAHQAKVTAIESMRQQTTEGAMRSSWEQQVQEESIRSSWEQQAQAGVIHRPAQQNEGRQMEPMALQTTQRLTEGIDEQMEERQESLKRSHFQTDGLQFSQAQSSAEEQNGTWTQNNLMEQPLASEPSVSGQNSALIREPLQRSVESEAPVPDRTVCYRTDAILKDQRSSGNSEASPASIRDTSSVQLSGKNTPTGESIQKDSSIKLTDPQELERLSKLEEEEEGAHDRVWERLKREHTRILAFDYEKGCEILTIKPQDIGLLPREDWVYGNNSFLLHGYYNYRYLILARLNNLEGLPRYLLGVPGHYYSNERYMASMFGFPNFVLSKEQPVGDGRFGYWYTDVKLGD